MIKITVSASKKYDVIMEQNALNKAAELLSQADIKSDRKLCIITDKTVNSFYGKESGILWQNLSQAGFRLYKYVFEGGESNKTMSTVTAILDYLADNKFSRSDALIALGGGIVGDVTGFSAASFLRGIDYIQIPTTLLATVDSSVGGKTGVNLKAGKNLAGAFWQPSLVIFDPQVLQSLPQHMILDGIAETIKAGFINDKTIIDEAENNISIGDNRFLTQLAAKAVEVKRKVVEEDERDNGSRQLLNFGHTLAHAIEKCSNYRISHGHAVAKGMAIVSAAADEMAWTSVPCAGKILEILKKFNFPLDCPYSPSQLTEAALQDKKIRGNKITLVIPESIGKCRLKTIATDDLEEFITCGMDALKGM